MDITKFFLKSKTIIGILLSVAPALLPALGISFTVDDSALVSSTVDALIQAVGAILGIYGRFKAGGISVV